jgi:glycosyltransferase involved in cell wall biosynthesis
MTELCVALLGRRDEPTDGVEAYCRYLGAGLSRQGLELEIIRVRWPEIGWGKGLAELQQKISTSEAKWFLVQYTALAWSRRGFPLKVIWLLRTLKKSGTRCAVVFHDPAPYPGERLVDRFRRMVQLHVMRRIARLADLVVLTIPVEKTSWLPPDMHNVRFIPVGANLPHPETAWDLNKKGTPAISTVAVFSVTGGGAEETEVAHITEALCFVAEELGPVRLSVFGRNSEIPGKRIKEELEGRPIEVLIHGILEPEEIVATLGRSDVMLFVRGPISTRRGSALAGVACGLPVVAYEGWETGGPIKEAGVVLLPDNSAKEFGRALVRVLKDEAYRRSLQERSKRAQTQFFSWEAIAAEYATALCKLG